MELKFIYLAVFAALLATHAGAQISNSSQVQNSLKGDLSNQVSFTLNHVNNKDKICKTATKKTGTACGDTFIYPVLSDHPNPTVESKINDYIQNLMPDSSKDAYPTKAFAEIKLNKNNFISILFNAQAYGADIIDSSEMLKCANLDLDTGLEIPIDQVLRADYQEGLTSLIQNNLDGPIGKRLPRYVRSTIVKLGTDWKLPATQPYYVDERDLILCFDESELSSEALGTIEIPISFNLINDLIDKSGPLAAIAEPAVPGKTVTLSPPKLVDREKDSNREEFVQSQINEIGSDNTTYSCFRGNDERFISVLGGPENSRYICVVEYSKDNRTSTIWNAVKDRKFCVRKAAELVYKYETSWNYTCGRRRIDQTN